MKTAIISDIHSNLPALKAVFADIEANGIKSVICLGDIIGYGPHPRACAELVKSRCRVVIRGNHEEALIHGGLGFNQRAKKAIAWTKTQLYPGSIARSKRRELWDFLIGLPRSHREGSDLFVHGSPRRPTEEYVFPHEVEFGASSKFNEIFASFEGRCFSGHTHQPMVMTKNLTVDLPEEIDYLWRSRKQALINVGSVGQPRDGDPRACYVIADDVAVEWRRVSYDIDRTISSMAAISELDAELSLRLLSGR